MEEKSCAKEKSEMDEALLEYLMAPIGYPPPSHQPLAPNKDITPFQMSTEIFNQMQQAQERKNSLWEEYLEKRNSYINCKKQNEK